MIDEIALQKLRRYCAYQDRCHQEVRSKLISIKVYGDDLEEIISELIREDFLNEERFARSYARGKFRLKSWGRNKIKQQLKVRRISEYCMKKAMEEIDETAYTETLKAILEKQMLKHDNLKFLVARDKAIQYSISRGYETGLVYDIAREIKEENKQ